MPVIVTAFVILITATATASYHSAKAALSSPGEDFEDGVNIFY